MGNHLIKIKNKLKIDKPESLENFKYSGDLEVIFGLRKPIDKNLLLKFPTRQDFPFTSKSADLMEELVTQLANLKIGEKSGFAKKININVLTNTQLDHISHMEEFLEINKQVMRHPPYCDKFVPIDLKLDNVLKKQYHGKYNNRKEYRWIK